MGPTAPVAVEESIERRAINTVSGVRRDGQQSNRMQHTGEGFPGIRKGGGVQPLAMLDFSSYIHPTNVAPVAVTSRIGKGHFAPLEISHLGKRVTVVVLLAVQQ